MEYIINACPYLYANPNQYPSAKRKRSESEDNRFETYINDRYKGKASSAYVFFAREKKWAVWDAQPELDYAGLDVFLVSQWDALSSEEKAPYLAEEVTESSHSANETVTLSSEVWLSSSTVVNETPKYITEAYEKALKRIRDAVDTEDEQDEMPRPAKRHRSTSPLLGTGRNSLEISSVESAGDGLLEEDVQAELGSQEDDDDEAGEAKTPQHSIEVGDLEMNGLDTIAPSQGVVAILDLSEDESDVSTPRVSRRKTPAFDTQAILSSPSQEASISALPPPARFTQLIEAEEPIDEEERRQLISPTPDQPSDASTTQSLQDFRCSLNDDSRATSLPPLPQPNSDSRVASLTPLARDDRPPSSSSSSTTSEDPDPPLAPDEIDEFFDVQLAEGFNNEFVTEALKHTRMRPDLAVEVLEAWRIHKPLPDKRGIWSREDDEDVESGDVMALERLQMKHGLDGWGGITERMKFLAKMRSRGL